MKNRFVAVFILALFASAAALTWLQINGDPAQAAEAREDAAQMSAPTPDVGVMTLERASLPTTSGELPGRTRAFRLAEIRPQVSGIVMQRLFEEGQIVEQGQALYQIDPAMYEVAVSQAEAALMTARADADIAAVREGRIGRLRDSDAVSQQDYDDIKLALAQAKAAVMSAEAALRSAEINLEYTRVYAPITGQISQSLVTEGALVTANQAQALAVVTQLDPIYVDVMQSSEEHFRMRAQLAAQQEASGGVPVSLSVADGVDYGHRGTLQFSSVFVSESTGSVQLRALFANPDQQLLPGMFVHANLQLGEEQVLLIPQQAAQRSNDGSVSVWRLSGDNTVSQVPVTVQRAVGNQWLLRDGLNPGDRIVVDGFQRLAPGMEVNPVAIEGQTQLSSAVSVN
ncbi:MAG: efflux RND transporter periplasmic adaptor subunit [Pseudohongiella sp.]|uniref:efflux RND transporter periplasmic adaptor subunit n=1 Tax=Pseudohongiella sp. TaxID=1979412 RepID=UPI0034A06FBE